MDRIPAQLLELETSTSVTDVMAPEDNSPSNA